METLTILQGPQGGWWRCHWILRMPICMSRSTSVTDSTFSLPSGIQEGAHCLSVEGSSFGLVTAPGAFTKTRAPVVGQLHLRGCFMYTNIDIFHLRLHCQFRLGFVVDLK